MSVCARVQDFIRCIRGHINNNNIYNTLCSHKVRSSAALGELVGEVVGEAVSQGVDRLDALVLDLGGVGELTEVILAVVS